MIGIYRISSPSNKIYIGQSVDIKTRFNKYNSLNCKGQIRLHNSLLKYGVDNHIFEILEECNIESLNQRERYYQDYYNATSEYGLNCILTETEVLPKKYSEKSKKKMSESQTGKHLSDETKLKISKLHKGKKYRLGHTASDETKLKMSNSQKGKVRSEKVKHAMSERNKGEKSSLYGKTGDKHYKSIKVINTDTGEIWNSIRECADENNIRRINLVRWLNGTHKNKTSFKYFKPEIND